MIQIGSVIDDRYEILKEIGRGGMSVVYLAMDNRLNKSLVVKDIRKRKHIDNELLINSLVAEANMLKRLDHWALPKIYDIIDSEGDIYVVMDYIEGESLKEKLKREKRISVDQVIEWAKQLADVLDYLHTRKPYPIIYRDMKPDNIMLTPEGNIKLIDFGIAREYKAESQTDTTHLGTKNYAAPEQISGKQTDARTDIYSLGVTLYHLVTGKSLNEPPYEVRPIREWDPSFPEGLEQIIIKCTQVSPEARFQSCRELSFALENINKLTKEYRSKLKRKMALFLIPIIMFFAFSTTSVFGYMGLKETQFNNYMSLINDASLYMITGENTKAIETLEMAIKVDKGKADAYTNLIDVYIRQNEVDEGLKKVEAYIEDGYGNIDQNNEVLFKLGMTYFDVKRDYVSAIRYFKDVDTDKIPDAEYYTTLATTLSSMEIDYSEFSTELLRFEKFNDGLPNDRNKVDNYYALANIYSSYKGQIADANTRTIKTVEKAYEVLKVLEDDKLNVTFEESFEQKLAEAFYSSGINMKQTDKVEANEDFEQAVFHYQNMLDLGTDKEEEIRIKIGAIYREMDQFSQATEQFENVIRDYPNSIDAYINLAHLLLDLEQNKEEASRNYTKALEIFHKAKSLGGATNNPDFKKLERRFETLNLMNS